MINLSLVVPTLSGRTHLEVVVDGLVVKVSVREDPVDTSTGRGQLVDGAVLYVNPAQ